MSTQKQYGLIGYPLTHSFSQRFFTDKFSKEGIQSTYTNFEIENVTQIIDILKKIPDLKGFNITLPHKQTIMPLLDNLSDEAMQIGAVNVVKIDRSSEGKTWLTGYNSDVLGFMKSISPLLKKEHTKALVLGTGGASRAIVYGLNKLGLDTQLVSRNKRTDTITYGDLSDEVLSRYKVIVNCTPLGTFPEVNTAPEIPYELLTTDHLLYDLVYNPEETEFLKKGKLKGATIKNGAEMLELQALEAWRIWNE